MLEYSRRACILRSPNLPPAFRPSRSNHAFSGVGALLPEAANPPGTPMPPNPQPHLSGGAPAHGRARRLQYLGLALVSGLLAAAGCLPAAELRYDSDSSSANGITDGGGPGWNTTATNKPWFNATTSEYTAWNNANLDTAVFGGGASGTAGTVSVGTVTAGSIIFNAAAAGSYTLNNGTITLGGATPTITANTDARINSKLVTTSLIKDGSGTLIINNSGNSVGDLTINAGRLDIYSVLASEDVVVNGSSSFITHSGNTWTMNSLTYASTASSSFYAGNNNSTYTIGAGGLTLDSTATLSINADNTAPVARVVLQGDLTANQSTTIGTGGNAAASSTTQRMIDFDGGVRNISVAATKTLNVVVSLQNGGFTKTGNGTLTLSGSAANLHGTTTVSAGTLILAKNTGVNALSGDITVNTGAILDWDNSDQLDDGASLFLNGGSLKFDGRNETLANLTQTSGNVNHSGGTNGGRVTITGLLRVSGGSSINLNSGGVWTVEAADFTGFTGIAISTNGNSTAGVNQFIIGAGGLTLSGQTISLAKGTAAGAQGSELVLNGDVTASGTNYININNQAEGVARVYWESEDRTWNITGGTTRSNAPLISMGGGLVKTGGGVLELMAANDYSGNTYVEQGTLKLGAASNIDYSMLISVASGATFDVSAVADFSIKASQTLEGGGTVNGSVIIRDGALLSPGIEGSTPVQQLTIAGNLTLESYSFTMLTLAGENGHDSVKVAGNFTQQNNSPIIVQADSWVPELGQSFQLFDWTGMGNVSSNLGSNYRDGSSDSNTDLDLPDISGSGFLWDISQFGTSGIIIIAVPEPSRLLLAGVAFAALGLRRRRI